MLRLRTVTHVVLTAMWLWASPATAEDVQLTILHTTDLHGELTDTNHLTDAPADRGLERIASMVKRIRAENEAVLLLDAGDVIHGSPIEVIHHIQPKGRPDPMMTAMSAMGYDAMALGNHELDSGIDVIKSAMDDATFPWLGANVRRVADGGPALDETLVKSIGGVRVGVIGITTPAVPLLLDDTKWRGLEFRNPAPIVQELAARLRNEQQCDVVVLLAHTGLEKDPDTGQDLFGGTPGENVGYRLAAETPGLDVVILGHTHTVVEGAEIGTAIVAQAGNRGTHLGQITVSLTRDSTGGRWRITNRESRVLAVNEDTPPDPEISRIAAPYEADTHELLSGVVATAGRDLDAPMGRLSDSALWEFIHRVQLEATGAQVSLAALFHPEATIHAGPVTWRDLLNVYPYDNTLYTVEMDGTQLKTVLERSARYLSAYDYTHGQPMESGEVPGFNFDSAEGVSYEIDLTRPVWDRIVNLRFRGEPLLSDQVVTVAVNSYRVSGGGGYTGVRDARRVNHVDTTIVRLMASYAKRRGRMDGEFVRNWQILPDYAATPERPLIDLLVRQGKAPKDEVHRLGAFKRAQRGDLMYWLARSFDWRAQRMSRAFADVPNALEPWVDGLLENGALGNAAEADSLYPFALATPFQAMSLCENAAHSEEYAVNVARGDADFRRSLLTGVSHDTTKPDQPFTKAQLLGMIANARYPTLRVMHTNDFHGAIEPSRDRRSGRMRGGSAYLAAFVEELRAENPYGTILLDGGDCFQGTMESNLQYGRPVVEQMNTLAYDAMAIGNHEFDWSADTLQNRVREMRFAALAANMIERASGRMPAWVRGDTVFTRRGITVGVLGLAYRYTPTVTLAEYVAPYRFENDSLAAARVAGELRGRNTDVVLAVGHVPAETNRGREALGGDLVRMARGIDDVDAWFGGHSHVFVEDEVNGKPVLIAGSSGRAVSVCDLVIDPVTDSVIESHFRLQETWHDEIDGPSEEWLKRVDRWTRDVEPIAETVIGRTEQALDRNGPESTIGNLMADAIREASGADVALQNSGGMRANLDQGEITRGEVYAIMPFDNTIVTVELTGAELKRALDEAMIRGRVTQVSGIRYTYDPDAPEMERVLEVFDADGKPLDPNTKLTVACNNFMATGGDDYETLAKGSGKVDTRALLRTAIEDYIRKRGTIEVKRDGRIQRVEAAAPVGAGSP